MADFDPRTRELLDDLRIHSKRSRFIFVALFVLAALSLVMTINEKVPWGNKGRIVIRMHNQISNVIESQDADPQDEDAKGERGSGLRVRKQEGPITKTLTEALMARDASEEEYLRRLELLSLETANVPLLGIQIASAHSGLLAAVAGFILYAWLGIAVRKEVSVLAHLFYPLVATADDEVAIALWHNGKDPKKTADAEDPKKTAERKGLEDTIDRYRDDAVKVREVASASFLTINSRYRRDWAERFSILLIILPMVVVFAHTAADIYWDIFRAFPANGGRNVPAEFNDHIRALCGSLYALPAEKNAEPPAPSKGNRKPKESPEERKKAGEQRKLEEKKAAEDQKKRWVEYCAVAPAAAIGAGSNLVSNADKAISMIEELRTQRNGLYGVRITQSILTGALLIVGVIAISVIKRGAELLTLAYCPDKKDEERFREKLRGYLDVPVKP